MGAYMKKLITYFSMVILLFSLGLHAQVADNAAAVAPLDDAVDVAKTIVDFEWNAFTSDNNNTDITAGPYTFTLLDATLAIVEQQTGITAGTTTYSITIGDLTPNYTYTWTVVDEDGAGANDGDFTFTTNMDDPTLGAETTPVALNETLTWSAAAAANVEYAVYLSTDGVNFTDLGVAPAITTETYTFQAGDLDPNVEYDVKIIASSTLAAPPADVESNEITFTTALTDPVLTALPATAEINSTLNWTASAADDVEYEVQANDGGSYASVVTGLTTTTYTFQPGDVTGNQAYDVKIIASSSLANVTDVESNEISFTTANVGLEGFMYDFNSGSPNALEDVLVEFTNTVAPFEVYSTLSAASTGAYQLYVPTGIYDVTFSKTGYTTLDFTDVAIASYMTGIDMQMGETVVINAPTNITQTTFDAHWDAFTGAVEYHVYVSTDPGCSGSYVAGFDDYNAGTNLSVTITGLTAGTTYYYKVIPYSYSYYPFESNIASVSTVAPAPVLVAPADFAPGVSIEPTFVWDGSSITTINRVFQLQVSTDDDFYPITRIVYENLNITPETFDMQTVTELLEGGTVYYWRVAAVLDGTVGDWSAIWSFTTTVPCYVNIIGPGNGIEIGSDEATLQWNSNAQGGNELYDLFYDTSDPGPDGFVGTTPQETDLTDKTFLLEHIPQGTTYYWQVRVKTSTGAVCGYSTVASFKSSGELLTPLPSAPVQGLVLNTTSPNLYWINYAYHPDIAYRVCYAETDAVDGSTYKLNDGTEEVTSWTHNNYIQLTDLTPGQVYHWQVQATSDGGTTMSEWSDPVSFEVYGSSAASPLIPIYPSGEYQFTLLQLLPTGIQLVAVLVCNM